MTTAILSWLCGVCEEQAGVVVVVCRGGIAECWVGLTRKEEGGLVASICLLS